MPDFNDLNSIYDKGMGPETTSGQVLPLPQRRAGEFDFARGSQYDPSEFNMPEGLYEAKGDPELRRGYYQSAWDKWGNFTVRTAAKIGTGIQEGIGYAGAFIVTGKQIGGAHV